MASSKTFHWIRPYTTPKRYSWHKNAPQSAVLKYPIDTSIHERRQQMIRSHTKIKRHIRRWFRQHLTSYLTDRILRPLHPELRITWPDKRSRCLLTISTIPGEWFLWMSSEIYDMMIWYDMSERRTRHRRSSACFCSARLSDLRYRSLSLDSTSTALMSTSRARRSTPEYASSTTRARPESRGRHSGQQP